MTGSLAPAEPYTTSFETAVVAVDGPEVTLDTSYFYPEGGGQPADRGTVGGVEVVDVQSRDGRVVHVLATEPGFIPGDRVDCEVDPSFRTYCMRAHTASHALYGAGRQLLDDLGYGGFGIGEEKVRIDFETSTAIDDDVLLDLERLVNGAVWESRGVTWAEHPESEARAIDGIAFNERTEEGVLAGGDAVRVVEIAGWDVAACGGTHVRNTREIGPVVVLGRSNPGEGLTRVELAVGPPGIERRIAERRAVFEAAAVLGTSPNELPGEVGRLRTEVGDLREAVADLEDRIASAQLDDLRDEVVEQDGARWLVGHVDGLDANALGERAKALVGDAADVVALVGADGRAFVAVAAEGSNASEIVEEVTEEFGGGGGGSPTFAQGGGLDADPDDIVAFLRG